MVREGNTNSRRKVADKSKGPWESWKGSRAGKCIDFIEKYLRPSAGYGHGQTLKLGEFQKDWISEILQDDVDAAVYSFPRGQGKSTLAAAIALFGLFVDDETGAPSIPLLATKITQAEKSTYNVAVGMINKEPELSSRSLIYSAIGNKRIFVPSNEGELFPISNDIDGIQGLNPSLSIIDEIGFQEMSVWSAMLLAAGKRPRSLTIGLGTPGYDKNSALFQLRKIVREQGDIPRFRYKEYSAPEGTKASDREAWYKANPALQEGFLNIHALETAYRLLPEAQFMTYRLGMWVEGQESWLGVDGAGVWDVLEDQYTLVEGAPTWVGIDAALRRDTTAVVAVQYREDGRLHAVAKIWTPTSDEPVDIKSVMHYIRQLTDKYKVGAVSFDPRFMDVPAKDLYDEGVPMIEIPQSVARMTPIIGDLYEIIMTGQLSHDKDELFRTHVLNAIPRMQENGFTLSKGKSRGHIDGVIALALAVDRARHKPKPRPRVVVL